MPNLRRALLMPAVGLLIVISPLYAVAGTIIQSAAGLNCSSNCINGVCTNTCTDNGAMYKGNGDITNKALEFKDFTLVAVSNIEFHVERRKPYFVGIEADSNLLENVIVAQKGRQLDISLKEGSYENASFKVTVGLPSIQALSLQGVEDGSITGFEQADIALSLQGIAKLTGENNHFQTLQYSGNGVTTLDFSKTKVENAQIDVDGSSNVLLSFASDSAVLSGIVQGVSSVSYCGNPDNQLTTHGVTDIKRIDC